MDMRALASAVVVLLLVGIIAGIGITTMTSMQTMARVFHFQVETNQTDTKNDTLTYSNVSTSQIIDTTHHAFAAYNYTGSTKGSALVPTTDYTVYSGEAKIRLTSTPYNNSLLWFEYEYSTTEATGNITSGFVNITNNMGLLGTLAIFAVIIAMLWLFFGHFGRRGV